MSPSVSIFLLLFCTIYSKKEVQVPKDPGLIKNVKPNFDAAKGLICYQCRSITSELQPLCDKSLFRLSTPEEKYNMSLQCPHYQGAYCFTKLTKYGRYLQTIRGCSKSTDKNGNLMKPGCMVTKQIKLCLCKRKFCNRATTFSQINVLAIVVIFRSVSFFIII